MSYPHNVGQSIFLHDITLTPNPNSNSNSNSNIKEQQQVEEEDPHHHHLPLSLFYFPSPFEDDDILLFQQHQYLNLLSPHDSQLPPFTMREATCGAETTTLLADDHQAKIKMVDWDSNNNLDKKGTDHHHEQQIPRRRSSKRDRHSKINTARGPRDRRMRLSLEVARKFFGLQDVLGFDKASKTVEWLIGKAEPEIKKLARDQLNIIVRCSDKRSTTSPATSESGEVVSGIDEAVVPNINVNEGEELGSSPKDQRKLGPKKLLRKRTFRPLAKASREMARARARARTLRENMMRGLKKPCEEESGVTQSRNNSTNYITTTITHRDSISLDPHNHEDDHRDYDPSVIMGKWSPSTILTSLQQNTGIVSQEHNQFADFQFYGKQPWEAYNNNHDLF